MRKSVCLGIEWLDRDRPSSPLHVLSSHRHLLLHFLPPLLLHRLRSITTMSSIIESIQKIRTATATQSLPLSHSDPDPSASTGGLRRRLSSLSLKLQAAPSLSASATASWAAASFRRSKSLSSMGEAAGTSIRRWWDWGWTWILSKKPVFARDLEMNEEEARAVGSNSRGSWKHVLFKVRSEIRKLVGSDAHMDLPQTIRQ